MWGVLARILIGVLASALPSLIGRILLSLGLSFITYTGLTAGATFLLSQAQSNLTGLPSVVLNFLAFCWVDKGIALIASTFTACLGIKTVMNKFTKLQFGVKS